MTGGLQILTVSQLCRYVKALLEEQKILSDIMVKGEVSNLSYKSASGHLYFSIRDEGGLLRCVMFSRHTQNLRELPKEGTTVLVRGTASLYERDGTFQLIAYDVQPLGAGQQQQSLEERKRRLLEEGLFAEAHKRPLPAFPHTIGIITSRDGAALQDILKAFRRRGFGGRLILYPAAVQGEAAPGALVRALEALEMEGECQAVIIARGGGSSEDLSAFNDEALARAAYACPVPVVSAVGHEVDFSILDFVADARAATPTAACELLVPESAALRNRLEILQETMVSQLSARLHRQKNDLFRLNQLLLAHSPAHQIEKNRQRLDYLVKLLTDAQRSKLRTLESRAFHDLRQLELLNPASVMRKGYSIAMRDGKVLSQGKDLLPGQEMTTIFADGEVVSTVKSYHKGGKTDGKEANH